MGFKPLNVLVLVYHLAPGVLSTLTAETVNLLTGLFVAFTDAILIFNLCDCISLDIVFCVILSLSLKARSRSLAVTQQVV